jgi:hypothetical protein
MVFAPPRLAGLTVGSAAVLMALLVAGAGIVALLITPISLATFLMALGSALSLVLAGLFGQRTLRCLRLRYRLSRDSLTIHWASRRIVVPLPDIKEVVEGEARPIRWKGGIHWFAYHVGQGEVEGLGPTRFYCTHLSPRYLRYLVTPRETYAISVKDPRRFALSFQMCRKLGPLRKVSLEETEGPLAGLPVWKDRWALGVFLLALALNLGLFAYLSYRYPSLPAFLPLHFAASGEVDRIGIKLEMFKLPGIALVVLGGNSLLGLLLHLRERHLALLCLVVALLVQILFWVAALRIAG